MPTDDDEGVKPGAHRHSHDGHHGHDCRDHDGSGESEDDDDDPPSTGFLPLSLAVALFVSGLFVLGFIPGISCG